MAKVSFWARMRREFHSPSFSSFCRRSLDDPMLLIMAGLPGTGKSALARAIAERTQASVLDKDNVRAALFPAELVEYSPEQDDFVLRVMLKVAGWIVKRDPKRVVVLDGRPFSKKYQIDMVI